MPRESLSRRRRDERLQAARHELSAFLDTLDPLLRKYLLDREPLTIAEARAVWLHVPPKRERQRLAAKLEYERLLSELPKEWNRYCKRQVRGFKIITEFRLHGDVPRRGAPQKPPQDSEAVLVAREVTNAKKRLTSGCKLKARLRAAGGTASDDTAIRHQLEELGYGDEECRAILRSRSALSAAVLLVARQLGKKAPSIRSSLARAKPLPDHLPK